MSVLDLEELIQKAIASHLDTLDYNVGAPSPLFRASNLEAIACSAIVADIIGYGPFKCSGMVIGLAGGRAGMGGIRSTNMVMLRLVISNIISKYAKSTRDTITDRWKRDRMARGIMSGEEKTEAERFMNQEFTGFD